MAEVFNIYDGRSSSRESASDETLAELGRLAAGSGGFDETARGAGQVPLPAAPWSRAIAHQNVHGSVLIGATAGAGYSASAAPAREARGSAPSSVYTSPVHGVHVSRHGSVNIGGGSAGRSAVIQRADDALARAREGREEVQRVRTASQQRPSTSPRRPRSAPGSVRVNRHGSVSIGAYPGAPSANERRAEEERARRAAETAARARADAAARARAESEARARAAAASERARQAAEAEATRHVASTRSSRSSRSSPHQVRVNRHGSISIGGGGDGGGGHSQRAAAAAAARQARADIAAREAAQERARQMQETQAWEHAQAQAQGAATPPPSKTGVRVSRHGSISISPGHRSARRDRKSVV